ncbi:MAG: MFS transporter [bacterium]|nr:MFS transporter [bacterium]
MDAQRLPLSTIVLYGSPVGAVFAASFLVSTFFLVFMTDVLRIAPATAGMIVLIGQVWDAINDPPIGHLSDRTRSRWGRRRPWMAASAIPLAVCTVAVWQPPRSFDPSQVVVWVLVSFLLLRTFYSTFRVPHLALGAELGRGYHDRTRVFGGSQFFENMGLVAAAVAVGLIENAEDPRARAGQVAVALGFAVVVFVFVATARLRERPEFQGGSSTSGFVAFRDVLRNPHARILILIFFLDQAGLSILLASIPYLSNWVLETPGNTAIYMGTAVLAMTASLPVAVVAARRFGKRRVWAVSMVARAVTLAFIFSIESGNTAVAIAWTFLIGFLGGSSSVIGPSLKADVIDWDEAESGARREGAYFATWNFAQKSATALAGGLIGAILAAASYDPGLAAQSQATRDWIRFTAGLVPCTLNVLAVVALGRFRLDEAAHRRAIERNRQGSRQNGGQGTD